MTLPAVAHTGRVWRIHELTHDFHLEDVWALRTPGGPGDLPRLVAQFAVSDFPRAPRSSSACSGQRAGRSARSSAGTGPAPRRRS